MRQKSIRGKRRKIFHGSLPTDSYTVFRDLLRELLESTTEFKENYLLRTFESKISDGPSSSSPDDRRSRAIDKWLETEVRNRDTNMRLFLLDNTVPLFVKTSSVPVYPEEFIAWCASLIRKLIGESPSYDLLSGSFSGGASTSIRRGVGVIPRKYQTGRDITVAAIDCYLALTRECWSMPRDFTLVPGNVMFTVPKTSDIDRCACKEPDLNMYCQKAVGDFFRRRLKTVGIDLNDQRVNQELARQGSIDGSLATIDLSSASDSVTKQLVISLLPPDWTHLLFDLRSPITVIDGVQHDNEMLSSMGNAFTFELESLIFWALTKGCAYFTGTKGRVSVYGDDIICPSGLRSSLEPTLKFFGFVVNETKSFWDGPFRESCGKHWFSGKEVTPFYVKKIPVTVSDWCLLLNSFRRWAEFGSHICDPRYYPLWELFASMIPKPLHGARDLSRRDALVAPHRRNIAVIRPVVRRDAATETEFQYGAYLQWLDTVRDRADRLPIDTNHFTFEGVESIGRPYHDWSSEPPVFPQEVE